MDASRFDALARALVSTGSRRGLLRFLAGLPLGGSLAALLAEDEVDAHGRRRRRKKAHKHGKGRRRTHHKTQCKANSTAKTCAGQCGPVKNNCKKTVDCGSCACDPPCPVCHICNETTGICQPDPAQQGDACGEPGQRCQSDGTCACDAASCDLCETCQGDGVCSEPCDGTGCCASGTCEAGTSDTACGAGGNACISCTSPDTCGGGDPGTPNVCGCTPSDPCTAGVCGTVQNNCGEDINCGGCSNPTPICVSNVCSACSGGNPCPGGQVCCGGSCFSGICCEDAECQPSGDDCVNNQCQCGAGSACSGGTPTCCGSPGACTNTDSDENNCGTCGITCSGATPVCWDGGCVCGDVCPIGCQFTSVQDAITTLPAGTTIRICAGTYGAIVVNKNLTLIGAGDGTNAASNTILDAAQSGRVVHISGGHTVSLTGLRLTGGSINDDGGGVLNNGALTMTDSTVTGNQATGGGTSGGGISNNPGADLTMTNCTISGNSAGSQGGGISTLSGTLTMTNCTVTANTAPSAGGGIHCNNGGITQLFGCVIGPNNTANNGGGINVLNSSTVTLHATSVTGNTATTSTGGGIRNFSGTVTLQNGSTVSGNNPDNCVGTINGSGCA